MLTPNKKEKFNAKSEIANRIIQLIESNNVLPWQVSYKNALPKNFASNTMYRGVNFVYLAMAQMACGYKTPYFLTYKQAQERKAQVRKGEKGFMVIKFNPPIIDEAGEMKMPPWWKTFTVFNVDQCDGIELPAEDLAEDNNPIDECESVAQKYLKNGPSLEIFSGVPCYSPMADKIRIPAINSFSSSEAYYSTLFHEITHSTGHKTRMNRSSLTALNSDKHSYSYEELIAEFGAAVLMGKCGIYDDNLINNSAGYISSWLSFLKKDPNKLVEAASEAFNAVDFVMGENK